MEDATSLFREFMPHGTCFLWTPEILWSKVGSDLIIAASYFSIPVSLYFILRKRPDWRFRGVIALFSAFIFWCGLTHVMSIITVWHGYYAADALVRVATAGVSFATAIALVRLSPAIVGMPTLDEIESANREIAERKYRGSIERAQRRAQRLMEVSLEAAPVGLMTLNAQGTVQVVNRELLTIFGYSREELVGTPVQRLISPKASGQPFIEGSLESLVNGRLSNLSQAGISLGLRKNGSSVPVEVRLHSEVLDDEPIIFASVTDQTERIEAEKTKSYLSSIVQSCDDAIIGKDLQGTITHWNQAAEKLFGYNEAQIVGQSVYQIVPEELVSQENHLLDMIAQGKKIQQQETERVRANGQIFPALVTLSPIKDHNGQIIGASTITRDITESKRAEYEMIQKNNALEASNKELENFAFIASHDLKEPLRKIQSFGKLLEENEKDLKSDSRDYLGYMLNAAARMQKLLQSLLQYSRVSSRANPFERVSMSEVVEEVLEDFQLPIEESGAEVIVDELPEVMADRSQMHQLLQNLISNAVKYRSSDRPLKIHIYREKSKKFGVEISVDDNGIGFDPQYSEQVFEIFKRLHGKSKYEGTGVGLAICRKIVERHGGALSVSASPQQGAKFTFFLPNAAPVSR